MLWIQQPTVPMKRWRLSFDAGYDVERGQFVSNVQVFDEVGNLCGALTQVSKKGQPVEDLAAWASERLQEVHDTLTPTFP